MKVALLALLALSSAQARPREAALERRIALHVPRMDGPEAQLSYARGLKQAMVGKTEEDREFWRELAVEAYRAVRLFHPDATAVGAEASFRAGELLRASDQAGREDEAAAEFARAAELGKGTGFRARGRLEIGHVERRRGRLRQALDAYLSVASDASADPSHRDDAWLWAGRAWQEEGRIDEARRAWRDVAERGADPIDRVLAFDYLAMSRIHEEDPEAAAGELDRCLRALSATALEETEAGERVRKALLRMRVVEALQREGERRARSPADTIGSSGERGTSRKP